MTVTQEELDLFAIRGFCGIIRLLEDRIRDNPAGFTPVIKKEISEMEVRFRAIYAHIMTRGTIRQDQEMDMLRLDRWFVGGFGNLITYLERRLQSGPPMEDPYRERLINELDRGYKLRDSLIFYGGFEKKTPLTVCEEDGTG